MSRSRKKTPITGVTTARSEADDKKAWHRAIRRAEKVRISTKPEDATLPERQFTSAWNRAKDGKIYWNYRKVIRK